MSNKRGYVVKEIADFLRKHRCEGSNMELTSMGGAIKIFNLGWMQFSHTLSVKDNPELYYTNHEVVLYYNKTLCCKFDGGKDQLSSRMYFGSAHFNNSSAVKPEGDHTSISFYGLRNAIHVVDFKKYETYGVCADIYIKEFLSCLGECIVKDNLNQLNYPSYALVDLLNDDAQFKLYVKNYILPKVSELDLSDIFYDNIKAVASNKTSEQVGDLYTNFCNYFGSWFDSEELKQEAFFHTLKAIS